MFNDIPENKGSYCCPECEKGTVTKRGQEWTCNNCPFFVEDDESEE